MSYEIRWTETALKALKRLSKATAKRIIEKVEAIKEDPFKFVKKLKGLPFYSLRIGDYRAILSMDGKSLVVFVLEIGHRKKIYKKF